MRKVYCGHYDYELNHPHPLIRLKGKYLESYGFAIGNTIEVNFEPHRITIKKVMP
jgi:hypothetical protein